MQSFSVLMSVYKNDNALFLKKAIESITFNQTMKPSEVIIVIDGPIPLSLESVIHSYETKIEYIRVVRLPKNKGLGNALRVGLQECKNEIVMRMDSDDISYPNRFEIQMKYAETHPDIDVLGGQISEFVDVDSNIVGYRIVPESPEEIAHMIKRRCPFNHVSVMLLRSRVLQVGNYLDWHFNEDYYLWIRMYLAGCKFANLSDTLVNVRVGKDMYVRRGGWKYFKSEADLQKYMLSNKVIGFSLYSFNVLVRFVVQIAMPNRLRGFVFKKILRK